MALKKSDISSTNFKDAYRQSIGLFATGVTVLIVECEGKVHCMTANAVSSLSLDPIQLIVCPSKTSGFSNYIKKGVSFTVNILGIHQEEISNHFAGSKQPLKSAKPLYEHLFSDAVNSPRLTDCLASFACQVKQMHDGDDHWIVVGEVMELYTNKKQLQPLLFFGGKYHYPPENEEEHIQPSADPLT